MLVIYRDREGLALCGELMLMGLAGFFSAEARDADQNVVEITGSGGADEGE